MKDTDFQSHSFQAIHHLQLFKFADMLGFIVPLHACPIGFSRAGNEVWHQAEQHLTLIL